MATLELTQVKATDETSIKKLVTETFKIFDHDGNNFVDIREIGTIMRSLGCCPSELELHSVLSELEDAEPTGFVRFEKFLPVMTKILQEGKYRPSTYDQLLNAFQVLDKDTKGYLNKEELQRYFMSHGEPFSQEEFEEMAVAFLDGKSQTVDYKDCIAWMVNDD